MNKYTLSVQNRNTLGRKVRALRSQGFAPANIFGKDVKSLNIQVNTKEFQKLQQKTGESTLLYLTVDGEKSERPVLVRDISIHPVTRQILHISFFQVNLKQKVTANVVIKLVGESPAEKEGVGILVQQTSEIEVEALPSDMPESVEVDISALKEVDTAIHIKDLTPSSKYTIKTDPDTIIAKIEPLAAEEKSEPTATPETPTATTETSTPESSSETPKEE